MSGGAQYVVAAYAVIWFLVLAYVVMLGVRTARVGLQVEAITRMLDRREAEESGTEPVQAEERA
ncbi:MAG: CcmD family protein [Actinobacteria bacterium]|nr:CcmD family protein [Actinomycetota bacterium]